MDTVFSDTPQAQSAIQTYKENIGGKKFFINPISKEDAEIVSYLLTTIKEVAPSVYGSMSEYKMLADIDILQRLALSTEKFFKDRAKVKMDKEHLAAFTSQDPETVSPWVDMKDEFESVIDLRHLFHVSKSIDADKYSILINKTPDNVKSVPIFSNTIFFYSNESDRDDMYNFLKGVLINKTKQ